MFNAAVSKIVDSWVDYGVIEEENKDIYIYGLDLVLFSTLNLLVILSTAAVTGNLIESILLIIVTVPLQMLGGGFHAKTHLNCFLIMYIGWWCVMWLTPNVSTIALIGIVACAVIIIFRLAPVANKNVPMSEGQSNKMKALVRMCAVLFGLISILSSDMFWGIQMISNYVAMGLGVIALSMLANKLQQQLRVRFTAK